MSYSATISFKKIKPEEIFDFFLKIKAKVKETVDQIAEDNFIFSPYARNIDKYKTDNYNIEIFKDGSDWARRVFTYRYFYNKDLELLGVYGLPDSIRCLFDDTLGFQNSCDQDYDFEYWDKIEPFKVIADRWKALTPEQVYEEYSKTEFGDYTKEQFLCGDGGYRPAYYAKTLCYDEIWEKYLEETLFSEDSIVYLSLFNFYDSMFIHNFILKVKKLYDNFIEECKAKANTQKAEEGNNEDTLS